jgi:hypothetical protein
MPVVFRPVATLHGGAEVVKVADDEYADVFELPQLVCICHS